MAALGNECLLKFCAQGTSPVALPFLEDAIASGEKDREGEGQGGGEKEWVVRLSRRKRMKDQRGATH